MGKRRRLWIALGGVCLAVALGTAALVLQRRLLTERVLARWLGGRGITATPRVSGFGFGGLELRDVSLGAADAPDLSVERIAVRWSAASLIGRRATTVEVFGAGLRARWEKGAPSLGVLDALLRPTAAATGDRLDFPVDTVAFHDAWIQADTPSGVVTARGDVEVTDDPRGPQARGDLDAETPWGPVHVVGEVSIAARSARRRWKAVLSAAVLEVPGVARLEGVDARGRGAGDAMRTRIAVARVTPLGAPGLIAPLHCTGTLAGTIERLAVDATATAEERLVLDLTGEVEPRQARAELALHVPETHLDGVEPGRLFPALAGSVTELRGTVAAEGHARYRDGKLGADLALTVREVDVVASLATVRRLNGVVTVVGPPASTPLGQTMAMAGIDGPLPLEDGTVEFALEPQSRLRLARAEWRFAGGTLRASGLIPLGERDRTLLLVADALSVETLLASLAFEGLSGTGTVSGALPLRQQGDTLLVEGGHLEATTPGTLRYPRAPGAPGGTGQQQLDLLLAVLTDFHYDELTLTLSGDTAKPMDMVLHIRGRNPDYQDGRTVVFNVNIKAPLVGLVRAGRSTYRVPAAIERRLERMDGRGAR